MAVPLASLASVVFATRDSSRKQREPAGDAGGYRSSLVDGVTPKKVNWDGRDWSADMGSTWNRGMDHCFQFTENRSRFEIRDTARDRAAGDRPGKRRSELHCTRSALPNGVPLWGAMSFNHHRWTDAAAMASRPGGVHGQVHMHEFGGSPALAFRRKGDGRFLVTTRGEYDRGGSVRWIGPVGFDRAHDLVYRLLLHPTDGELAIWLDGVPIVNLQRVSIGSALGGCYWCIGCYYGGGIAGTVVAEYANHDFFGVRDLSRRIPAAPAWPAA